MSPALNCATSDHAVSPTTRNGAPALSSRYRWSALTRSGKLTCGAELTEAIAVTAIAKANTVNRERMTEDVNGKHRRTRMNTDEHGSIGVSRCTLRARAARSAAGTGHDMDSQAKPDDRYGLRI